MSADPDPLTVLLIEDDDVDAMGLERSFRKVGVLCDLRRVRDGHQGLELLKTNKLPDRFLVLLDLNLPGKGGLEFLRRIRRDPALKHLVVFVLTTSHSSSDLQSAYEEHIAGYMVKGATASILDDFVQMLDLYWRVIKFPKCSPS